MHALISMSMKHTFPQPAQQHDGGFFLQLGAGAVFIGNMHDCQEQAFTAVALPLLPLYISSCHLVSNCFSELLVGSCQSQ